MNILSALQYTHPKLFNMIIYNDESGNNAKTASHNIIHELCGSLIIFNMIQTIMEKINPIL